MSRNNPGMNLPQIIDNTEFTKACRRGDIYQVQQMLFQASPEEKLFLLSGECEMQIEDGTTVTTFPLFAASYKGNEDMLKLLLDHGADPDQTRTTDGATPIIIASQIGYVNIVQTLLEYNANPNLAEGKEGYSPLILASHFNHPGVVKLLLEKGAIIGQQTKGIGESPLHIASKEGNTEIMKFLLGHGADPDQPALDLMSSTPLSYNVVSFNSQGVKILLAAGANPNHIYVNRINGSSTSPLATAWTLRYQPTIRQRKELAELGADLNKRQQFLFDESKKNTDVMINLLNAIYESEEVGCNMQKFIEKLDSASVFEAEGNIAIRMNDLVVAISRSSDPLSAKVNALMIQVCESKGLLDIKDGLEAVITNPGLAHPTYSRGGHNHYFDQPENIKTLQMAHLAQSLFADNRNVLDNIPANLTGQLKALRSEIAQANDQVEFTQYARQEPGNFDQSAKEISKYIYNMVGGKSPDPLDKYNAANIALSSYLVLKSREDEVNLSREFIKKAPKHILRKSITHDLSLMSGQDPEIQDAYVNKAAQILESYLNLVIFGQQSESSAKPGEKRPPSPDPGDVSSRGGSKSLKSQGGSSRGDASNY